MKAIPLGMRREITGPGKSCCVGRSEKEKGKTWLIAQVVIIADVFQKFAPQPHHGACVEL